MPHAFQNPVSGVRFGTEKDIGFPVLIAIFDPAVSRGSSVCPGSGGGVLPQKFVELSVC